MLLLSSLSLTGEDGKRREQETMVTLLLPAPVPVSQIDKMLKMTLKTINVGMKRGKPLFTCQENECVNREGGVPLQRAQSRCINRTFETF